MGRVSGRRAFALLKPQPMEIEMSANTKSGKRPTHMIWQVIGEGDDARWIRVGAAWENRDGKGLSLQFDSYPVVGRTVIRVAPGPEAETKDGGQ
jgi:hypothetical protein